MSAYNRLKCWFFPILSLLLLAHSGCSNDSCDPEGILLNTPISDTAGLEAVTGGMLIPVPYGIKGKNYTSFGHGGVDLGSNEATSVIAPAAGTIRQVIAVDLGSALLIDLGQGNCGVRLTHVSDVLVAEGDSVTEGQTIGTFTVNPSGNFYVLHYELSGITEMSSTSDSNAVASYCPFLYSSDSVKESFEAILNPLNSDVKTAWSTRDDTVLPLLGQSAQAAGYCYPLDTESDVAPTFP